MSENKINSSFGEITLQVSPAQLNSMASDISKKADTVNSSFSDIYSKVDGMLIYWRGVVADEKVSALKKQKESTDNMIKNLKHMLKNCVRLQKIMKLPRILLLPKQVNFRQIFLNR